MENDNIISEEYPEQYQLSMDIDWFFSFKDYFIHVASNGHKLPSTDSFKVYQDKNVRNQQASERLIQSKDNKIEDIVIRDNPRNLNYRTFEEFAKIGFISVDTINDDKESTIFHVIARPKDYKSFGKDNENLKNNLDIDDLNIIQTEIRIYDIDGEPLVLE